MIKANVKFFGTENDKFGMPIPYHSYLVVATPWQEKDSGVASVMAVSSNSPLPDSPHEIARKGGEEAAYNEMLSKLRQMSQNSDLKELVHRE